MIFVACGVSRLAQYNVTAESMSEEAGKVKYFEDTPIPTSLVLVLILAAATWQNAIGESFWFRKMMIAGFMLHPLIAMFAVSGSLMISHIRIPKL